MGKLSARELDCAVVLVGRGESVRSIARDLQVDEDKLRYGLARRAAGAADGRKGKAGACDGRAAVVEAWTKAASRGAATRSARRAWGARTSCWRRSMVTVARTRRW